MLQFDGNTERLTFILCVKIGQRVRQIYREMDRKPERNSAVWCNIDRWTESHYWREIHKERHETAQLDCVLTDRQTFGQIIKNSEIVRKYAY